MPVTPAGATPPAMQVPMSQHAPPLQVEPGQQAPPNTPHAEHTPIEHAPAAHIAPSDTHRSLDGSQHDVPEQLLPVQQG